MDAPLASSFPTTWASAAELRTVPPATTLWRSSAMCRRAVPRPPYPRDVVEFNRMFPDEEACLAYLAQCRWPNGFRCPRCGDREAFALPRRRLWQCKACGHQTSVTAGGSCTGRERRS